MVDLVAFECGLDHIGKESGFASHHLGELLRALDSLPDMCGEFLDEEFEGREIMGKRKNFSIINDSDTDGGGEFAISKIDKLQVIGKDQIVKRTLVSVKLLLVSVFLYAMKVIVPDVFGLDVPDGNSFFICQDIIRSTTSLTFGFVGCAGIRNKRFEEVLQITAESMFGGIAEAETGIEGLKVFGYGHEKTERKSESLKI